MEHTLTALRRKRPLVHNITNYVTVNDVANMLLACGASPIMADEPDEAEEITSVCDALNINIGTLNKQTVEAMFLAGRKAAALGHVTLLDPVGAGAGKLRTETALRLMREIPFDIVRGNVSEIKALALGTFGTKGVDAAAGDAVTDENLDSMIEFVQNFARQKGCIAAVTGAVDLVGDGERCYVIRNGHPEMSRITGTGCQLSGMMAAFAAAAPENRLEAAAAAVCLMGLAGEIAFADLAENEGNATYRNRIIDTVCRMDEETLKRGAKYEIR